MSLSGSIASGTVTQLLDTLSKSKRQVTLLLHNNTQFGHVMFEGGELVSVTLDDRVEEEALEALCAWEEGIYTIIKARKQGQASHAHAVLVGNLAPSHKELELWLNEKGFQTSLAPYHSSVVEIARFMHPDVVIVTCQEGGTCHDLRRELLLLSPPPIVLLMGDKDGRCAGKSAPCANAAFSIAQVKHSLAARWPAILDGEAPKTRGSADQASAAAGPRAPADPPKRTAVGIIAALSLVVVAGMFFAFCGGSEEPPKKAAPTMKKPPRIISATPSVEPVKPLEAAVPTQQDAAVIAESTAVSRTRGPRRRHRSRAAAARRGTLIVQANEPATVWVDGVRRGTTPARIVLATGSHTVTAAPIAAPQAKQQRAAQVIARFKKAVRFVFPVRAPRAPSGETKKLKQQKGPRNKAKDRLPTDNIDPWAR